MKFYVEGEKGKAICDHCNDIVPTTYERRDVPFSDGEGMAKNILVATCDQCKEVVAIPAQSTPAIKESRKVVQKSIEARLPAVYLDILDYAMQSVNSSASTQHRKLFIGYYLHHFARHQKELTKASYYLGKDSGVLGVNIAKSARRLSMKVNKEMEKDFDIVRQQTKLSSTDIIKWSIIKMREDLVDHKNPEAIKQLETITAVAC